MTAAIPQVPVPTATMQTVELKHRTMILAGSVDAYGMNRRLQDEEVDSAW